MSEKTLGKQEKWQQEGFVSTGYESWDELCGGLKKGELTLLAARPGMGKTSLGLNIVSRLSRRQCGTILIFSPDLPPRDVTVRLLSIGTGLMAETLLSGKFSAAELTEKHREFFHAQKANIKINASTMPSLEDISRACHTIPDLQLVVVNAIERVSKPFELWDNGLPVDKNSEPKDKVLQALKTLAEKLQVPVLCTACLHRSLELRKNKRPRLGDLKKTGIPAEVADQIVFLYRDRYYDYDGHDGAECIIAKSSQGKAGVLALSWEPATGRFL